MKKWQAYWIWCHDDGTEKNRYTYFRREFTGNTDKTVTLHVSADTRFRLYLDGALIGRGPLMSQPYNTYYEEYTLDLPAGRHCLAAEVYYQGLQQDSRGGFLLEALDGDGSVLVKTDESWRGAPSPAWSTTTQYFRMNKINAFQEFFDAGRVPSGWNETGFDDAKWDDAAVIQGRIDDHPPQAGPWTLLQKRDIPRMQIDEIYPEAIQAVGENVSLANRNRPEDVSIQLSMPGTPLNYATAEHVDSLLSQEGTAEFRCSTEHLADHTFDGFYEPSIVLDFGRQRTAYMELELEGPRGAWIEFGFAERLIDGNFNNSLEGYFGGKYTLAGEGRETFRTFNWIGFRYLKLRVRSAFESVKLHRVTAVNSTYPFSERGSFRSGDTLLDGSFDISRYTIRLCCNEFITDTPWREQGQWLGDVAAVTLGGIYSCFGDTALPSKFLKQSAMNMMPTGIMNNMTNSVSFAWLNIIPDYSLWWVQALWNHYLYTGEEGWLHRFYPQALRVYQYYAQYLDDDGLIYRSPNWSFVDWAPVDRRGKSAAVNGIFYMTLKTWAKIADLRGDSFYAGEFRNAMQKIEAAFASAFFDDEKGCCVDGIGDDGPSKVVSEHSNALAMLNDLVDGKQTARIIETLYGPDPIEYVETQPFFCTFALLALTHAGRFDLAIEMVRDRWGRRMVEKGAGSVYEEWGINGSWRNGPYHGFMRTQSHAWSAFPAEFLTRHLIGFEILDPGCTRIRIAPQEIGRDYEVVLPLPQGDLKVTMKGGDYTADTPAGVELA
jgi:alpha-L-rhamnosidase